MNSKDISGNKQVLAAAHALERVNARAPPSEGVRGEGEKVRRLLGPAFLCTPESRALFLPGAKSWQNRFRNVGEETLVKGFGGGTRGGAGERRPQARGPQARAPCSRVRAGRGDARPWGCRRAGAARSCTPWLARPRPGVPAPRGGDPPPPLGGGTGRPPPQFPSASSRSRISSSSALRPWTRGRKVALGGSGSDACGERKGRWRGETGRQARPARTPGSQRRGGKPRPLAPTGARRLLPPSPLSPARPRQSRPPAAQGGRAAASDLG